MHNSLTIPEWNEHLLDRVVTFSLVGRTPHVKKMQLIIEIGSHPGLERKGREWHMARFRFLFRAREFGLCTIP